MEVEIEECFQELSVGELTSLGDELSERVVWERGSRTQAGAAQSKIDLGIEYVFLPFMRQ